MSQRGKSKMTSGTGVRKKNTNIGYCTEMQAQQATVYSFHKMLYTI